MNRVGLIFAMREELDEVLKQVEIEEEFTILGKIICKCLKNYDNEEVLKELKEEVLELTRNRTLF